MGRINDFLSLAATIIMLFSVIICVSPVKASPSVRYVEVNIDITTTGGVNRFFTVQTGDTLVQVVNPLYTVAASTTAMFTTRDAFTGTISGDLSGSLTNGKFNTIWVDITGTSMRGLTAGHAEYGDSIGGFSLIMVLDVEATLSGGNIVAASLKGYAFSKSANGGYAGTILFARLEGSLTGVNKWSFKGKGYICSQAQCPEATFSVTGSRESAPGEIRVSSLYSSDTVVQFATSDMTLPENATAGFTTRQKLIGTSSGYIAGSFTLDSNAFIITSGTYVGRGYSIARFTFTGSDTLDGFLILDNSNYGVHNGYIVGASGTGVFAGKFIVGTFQGTFKNPPNYYDYEGSGSIRICSIPPPVGGIIVEPATTEAYPNAFASQWPLIAITAAIIAAITMLAKKRAILINH